MAEHIPGEQQYQDALVAGGPGPILALPANDAETLPMSAGLWLNDREPTA
jgi:hypothetical protein